MPDKIKWLKAANKEFASLLGMQTWKLIPRPKKQKIIKSKWVFKVKNDQTTPCRSSRRV